MLEYLKKVTEIFYNRESDFLTKILPAALKKASSSFVPHVV